MQQLAGEITGQTRQVGRMQGAIGDQYALEMPLALLAVALADQLPPLLLALHLQHAGDHMRLNDGRTDRAGRFVVGSLVKGRHELLGALYQISGASLREIDRGFCVSNTTCFSPDGRWMYFADSLTRHILRYAYNTATGEVGPREVFIDTAPWNTAPDGATVDADGVAHVAPQQVDSRYRRLIGDAPVI